MPGYRIEEDSMGTMQVPESAYWGAQTQRAVENFPISGRRFPRPMLRALGLVKRAAAEVNQELSKLDSEKGAAIVQAATAVLEGKLDDQFVVDIYQTGSGTSTNMNANEVIASYANELLGGKRGAKSPVHPNDHVNMGQSSNDVIPTCIHIAVWETLHGELWKSLEILREALEEKAQAFHSVLKIGRTHLQDATPIRLGQEFSGYAAMVAHSMERLRQGGEGLAELPIGGTAVGTGINTHPEFGKRVAANIAEATQLPFREAGNHFAAQGGKDALVAVSSALKGLAVSLTKIANDVRWLGSGPRCGIGEIRIPAVQPGSSIMPGKVNPVMAEALLQVSARVIGNDATVALAALSGNFELNVMMPVMADALLESELLFARAVELFAKKCILGIEANEGRCQEMIEKSLAMCTSLSPKIGYDAAAKIAKRAFDSGRTVREVALEEQVLTAEELDALLDPEAMAAPG